MLDAPAHPDTLTDDQVAAARLAKIAAVAAPVFGGVPDAEQIFGRWAAMPITIADRNHILAWIETLRGGSIDPYPPNTWSARHHADRVAAIDTIEFIGGAMEAAGQCKVARKWVSSIYWRATQGRLGWHEHRRRQVSWAQLCHALRAAMDAARRAGVTRWESLTTAFEEVWEPSPTTPGTPTPNTPTTPTTPNQEATDGLDVPAT